MKCTLLVIPHYNDTKRLRPFLKDLLTRLPANFSILISDDGSSAEEQRSLREIIADFQESDDHTAVLLNPLFTWQNTGKGGAVHRGWKLSEGFSYVAFADADGAVSAGEIVRAERFLNSEECQADAIFGSRVKMLGRSIHRTLKRHLSGRVFATLVFLLTKIPAYDTQCGLKILSIDAYQKVAPHFKSDGFAFDVELCLLLLKMGQSIEEFPIDWYDVEGSKVSLFRDSYRMLWEVISIRRRVDEIGD